MVLVYVVLTVRGKYMYTSHMKHVHYFEFSPTVAAQEHNMEMKKRERHNILLCSKCFHIHVEEEEERQTDYWAILTYYTGIVHTCDSPDYDEKLAKEGHAIVLHVR